MNDSSNHSKRVPSVERERALVIEGLDENLYRDADGKIVPSREAREQVEREHANEPDHKKWQLAQMQTLLDAAKSKLPPPPKEDGVKAPSCRRSHTKK